MLSKATTIRIFTGDEKLFHHLETEARQSVECYLTIYPKKRWTKKGPQPLGLSEFSLRIWKVLIGRVLPKQNLRLYITETSSLNYN
jgi:hypothetical protein